MTNDDPAEPTGEPASAPLTEARHERPGPPGATKRPLTIGQRILLGAFMLGFGIVSLVIVWAQTKAHYHRPHHY